MRLSVLPRCLFGLALFAASAESGHAQTFVRVTDSPIATEAMNSGGGTWFDADGDGDLDLFVANGNLDPQPNSLFLNDGTGSFEAATDAGDLATDAESSIGGAAGDYDGDGDLDLFVTNRTVSLNALYRNDGGSFTRVEAGDVATDEEDSNTSSWVDADGDGDLDLFVTNFNAANFFYRNDGGLLTRADLAPLTTVVSPSINGTWADFDGDGDSDYFMGNGTGADPDDILFRNDGDLTFAPLPFSDGVATLGSSWGDFDADGDLDLFTAHFLSADNGLYENTGPPGAALLPLDAPPVTSSGGQSTGSAWGDVDNDGDLDLFVANFGEDNVLYLNTGPPDYAFEPAPSGPATTDGGASFGTALADYDADGDLDLFVANQNGTPNFLYENQTDGGSWLQVDLAGALPNTTALGARVLVTATIDGTERTQLREVLAQTGYNSQTLRLHVGLGDAATADVRVRWPSGATTILTDVPVDQALTLTEETDTATDEPAPGAEPLLTLYPNPMTETATIEYGLAGAGSARLAVYSLTGRLVRVLADEPQPAGVYGATWDGRDEAGRAVSAGAYVLMLTHGGRSQSLVFVRIR